MNETVMTQQSPSQVEKSYDETILACQQLTKAFYLGTHKIEVLQQVNLTISPAERIAIVGASGTGKSTLLHLLGGLDTPSAGAVFVGGKNLTAMSESQRSKLRNQTLGFVYQFHHILPEFTVLENVSMPLLIRGERPAICIEKARFLLNKVGLQKREQHKLSELSGGERQRTAIARAMVTDPICLLADEPTGNLDEQTAKRIYENILELNQTHKTSLVVVTHDISLTRTMDKVYRLQEGQLLLT